MATKLETLQSQLNEQGKQEAKRDIAAAFQVFKKALSDGINNGYLHNFIVDKKLKETRYELTVERVLSILQEVMTEPFIVQAQIRKTREFMDRVESLGRQVEELYQGIDQQSEPGIPGDKTSTDGQSPAPEDTTG